MEVPIRGSTVQILPFYNGGRDGVPRGQITLSETEVPLGQMDPGQIPSGSECLLILRRTRVSVCTYVPVLNTVSSMTHGCVPSPDSSSRSLPHTRSFPKDVIPDTSTGPPSSHLVHLSLSPTRVGVRRVSVVSTPYQISVSSLIRSLGGSFGPPWCGCPHRWTRELVPCPSS